jgi:hypothetical protein
VLFAAAVTSILAPPSAIELGTASGFSTAIIAKIMALREAERGAPGKSPLLHTIDKCADFPPDPTKPIGFAIDLVAPELRERIVLHPLHDSSFARSCRPMANCASLSSTAITGIPGHWSTCCASRRGWLVAGFCSTTSIYRRRSPARRLKDERVTCNRRVAQST